MNAKYMDTVSLKVRRLIQESQDVTDWKTIASFHSTVKNRHHTTQNIMEPDNASVTVYLPIESDDKQLLQLGWCFNHLRQPSLSNENDEERFTPASIFDISLAVKSGLDLE